jgi:pimeloyl-ACP methyl ester carboxylesterase
VIEPVSQTVNSGGVALNVYSLGDEQAPTIIMLHAMRDVARSLMPVANLLATDYHVLLPDLRGHGRSARTGNYAMPAYLFDVHCILNAFNKTTAAVFGHSLGGQIGVRFAALYPERVRAAILVEGLGPPSQDRISDPSLDNTRLMAIEAQRILDSMALPPNARPLPDLEYAASRLLANNPRLTPARASDLAANATESDQQGNLLWSFDPRVASVFLGISHEDSERYWREVHCPTLLITGAQAHDYWSQAIPTNSAWTGGYAAGELADRLNAFRDHEHQLFTASGHMVHYDEPDRLAQVSHEFLRRRYE